MPTTLGKTLNWGVCSGSVSVRSRGMGVVVSVTSMFRWYQSLSLMMGPERVGLTIQRLMPAFGSRLSLNNSPQLPTVRAWNWNSKSLEPDLVTMLETPPDQVGASAP